MMQKLQRRSTAALITLCVVAFSVLLGANLSLNRLRDQAATLYYHGAGGATWMGIEYDLTEIAENSSNLVTVAGRYLDANDQRINAVERQVANLYASLAYRPAAQYEAAVALQEAVDELDAHLRTLGLSDADKTFQGKLMANIQSAYKAISQNSYNDAAREFNQVLEGFPANVLGGISGVKPLELYE